MLQLLTFKHKSIGPDKTKQQQVAKKSGNIIMLWFTTVSDYTVDNEADCILIVSITTEKKLPVSTFEMAVLALKTCSEHCTSVPDYRYLSSIKT